MRESFIKRVKRKRKKKTKRCIILHINKRSLVDCATIMQTKMYEELRRLRINEINKNEGILDDELARRY